MTHKKHDGAAGDVFEQMAAEIDACPETAKANPPVAKGVKAGAPVGATYAEVARQLRGAGVPILMILLTVGPLVLDGIRQGKTVAEIVADILAKFTAGQLER